MAAVLHHHWLRLAGGEQQNVHRCPPCRPGTLCVMQRGTLSRTQPTAERESTLPAHHCLQPPSHSSTVLQAARWGLLSPSSSRRSPPPCRRSGAGSQAHALLQHGRCFWEDTTAGAVQSVLTHTRLLRALLPAQGTVVEVSGSPRCSGNGGLNTVTSGRSVGVF